MGLDVEAVMEGVVSVIVAEGNGEPVSLLKLSKIVSAEAKRAAKRLADIGKLDVDEEWNLSPAGEFARSMPSDLGDIGTGGDSKPMF